MAVTDKMIQNARDFEGVIPHMYLDTKNNVTVGVGFLLPNAPSATNLGFIKRAGGAAASADEVKADWDSVKGQAPNTNFAAAHYKQFTKLDLPNSAVNAELRRRMESFESELKTFFPDYDQFPAPAQEGLMDMIFNLGSTKLQTSFPSFTAAVKAKDWQKAAQECKRTGVSAARNNAIKALFTQAVQPVVLG